MLQIPSKLADQVGVSRLDGVPFAWRAHKGQVLHLAWLARESPDWRNRSADALLDNVVEVALRTALVFLEVLYSTPSPWWPECLPSNSSTFPVHHRRLPLKSLI